MIRGLNHVPFAPIPVWDVTMAGTVISGDATSYLLVETDAAGRSLRRFERAVPSTRIDRDERSDSAKALQRRIDSLPVPIARLDGVSDAVKSQSLPATYPAYTAVFAAEDGRVWVRRWAPAGRSSETFFDVFDAEAKFLGTGVLPVVLAAAQHPVIRPDIIVGVVVDRETDLESVVRLRFDLRPGGGVGVDPDVDKFRCERFLRVPEAPRMRNLERSSPTVFRVLPLGRLDQLLDLEVSGREAHKVFSTTPHRRMEPRVQRRWFRDNDRAQRSGDFLFAVVSVRRGGRRQLQTWCPKSLNRSTRLGISTSWHWTRHSPSGCPRRSSSFAMSSIRSLPTR